MRLRQDLTIIYTVHAWTAKKTKKNHPRALDIFKNMPLTVLDFIKTSNYETRVVAKVKDSDNVSPILHLTYHGKATEKEIEMLCDSVSLTLSQGISRIHVNVSLSCKLKKKRKRKPPVCSVVLLCKWNVPPSVFMWELPAAFIAHRALTVLQ